MSPWRPTAGLLRALLVAVLGLGPAVVLGSPAGTVLAAPFALWVALGLLARPRGRPRARAHLEHDRLHEGRTTTLDLDLADAAGTAWVTRAVGRTPFVGLRPHGGVVAAAPVGADGPGGAPTGPPLQVRALRWGRHDVGAEHVALLSGWAGFRHGPVVLPGHRLTVLPLAAPFTSDAEAPQPVGLVGAHRSRRPGTGTELADLRPFRAGDRLRRISWRVTLRTGDLHVVETRAEQDSGVLLVLDALADHGASGGVDGTASSLDVGVRAASALASHVLRTGDRVALQVVGGSMGQVPAGSGRAHLHRVESTLARLVPGPPPGGVVGDPRRLPVASGTVVVVLSALLDPAMVALTLDLARRGLPTLVVDTLLDDVRPPGGDGHEDWAVDLAWRIRLLERAALLGEVTRRGTPVVDWRGPGTLDEVLRGLGRRARQSRVVRR